MGGGHYLLGSNCDSLHGDGHGGCTAEDELTIIKCWDLEAGVANVGQGKGLGGDANQVAVHQVVFAQVLSHGNGPLTGRQLDGVDNFGAPSGLNALEQGVMVTNQEVSLDIVEIKLEGRFVRRQVRYDHINDRGIYRRQKP